MKRLIVASSTLMLTACVGQVGGHQAVDPQSEDYRISVEIPLQEMHVEDDAILRVDELLNERTHFNADDFQLDELVLVARAAGEDAKAELLVLEWRSGQFVVPEGDAEDWYEVRIPAPPEDLEGAWLLDINGDVTVDLLVAVLEPRPKVVEVARTTAHRTRTVYRSVPPQPTTLHTHWIYEPSRYYVYHYHDVWPYRYYIGPWTYRYYDLGFRPHRFHYGPLYRPRQHWYWQDQRFRDGPRDGRRPQAAEQRRIDPQLVKLRRNHPRWRSLQGGRRGERANGDIQYTDAQRRFEEAKRSHPRLRAFHRGAESESPSASPSASERDAHEEPHERRAATLGRLSSRQASARQAPSPERRTINQRQEPGTRSLPNAPGARNRAADVGRVPAANAPTTSSRVRALRNHERRAAVPQATSRRTVAPVRRAEREPVVRTQRQSPRIAPRQARIERRAAPVERRAAPVERRAAPVERATPRGNVRSRSLGRQPQSASVPQRQMPRRAVTPQRRAVTPQRRAVSPPRPNRQPVMSRQAPAVRSAPPPREASRPRSNARSPSGASRRSGGRTFERR